MRVHAKIRSRNNRSQVADVVVAHRKLLKQFNRVAYYVSGVCAGIYLPGVGETFDVPVRKITGKRPVFVTLEATPHGLMLSGAISRLKAGQMQWRTIFDYDFTLSMTWRGGGRVLSAKNLVIARVGLELLRGLIEYADAVAANEAGDLLPAVFPEIIVRDGGKVVAEDYTPVLGLPVANPAAELDEVTVRRYNAAGKVLARRGAARLSEIPEEMWPVVMAEFRAEYPDVSLAADVVLEALQDQQEWIHFPLPPDEALATAPEAVVQAIREKLPGRFRYEASHKDVLLAAANPQNPLRISRLSRLQMFPVETVQDLPEGYTGSVLSAVKMIPPPPAILPADPVQTEV